MALRTSTDDDGDRADTTVVRISTDLHNTLRVIAAVEQRSLRSLLDEWVGERAEDWCNSKPFNLKYKRKR